MTLVAMSGAAAVMLIAVVAIVLALVYYLVSTIVALRKISSGLDRTIDAVGEIVLKSAPVNEIVVAINEQLDAGVDLLEGLLVKKAGLTDAVGLIDGLYPGAAAAGLRGFPESTEIEPPRIGEVYTKGTLTLARLGREAPIAAASPSGGVLRNIEGGSLAARLLYDSVRHESPENAAALARDRHRLTGPIRRARRCRRTAQTTAVAAGEWGVAGADPGSIRVRARDQRRRRDRGARTARAAGADRRRRPQPAADDETAPGQPRAPDRHQRAQRALLHPRAGRRDQDRCAHPPRRAARIRAPGSTLSPCSPTPSG